VAFNNAGDLFVGSTSGDDIVKITRGGAQSTFASGLDTPYGLAFDSAGNLFEADASSGNIYEFTPDGAKSTFASGLSRPLALAFNSAGDLFANTEKQSRFTWERQRPAGEFQARCIRNLPAGRQRSQEPAADPRRFTPCRKPLR
jgi:DNA-binding beta-propeller fold protein YncE